MRGFKELIITSYCSVCCVVVKESKPLDITFSAGVELLDDEEKEVCVVQYVYIVTTCVKQSVI